MGQISRVGVVGLGTMGGGIVEVVARAGFDVIGVEATEEQPHLGSAVRVYSDRECDKLDSEVRGLLMSLEQNGILDSVSRELVIDRLLAIDHPQVLAEDVKWVSLLVLMNRPGREDAFTQVEDMLYNEEPVYLH